MWQGSRDVEVEVVVWSHNILMVSGGYIIYEYIYTYICTIVMVEMVSMMMMMMMKCETTTYRSSIINAATTTITTTTTTTATT